MKGETLPLSYVRMMPGEGFEPSTISLEAKHSVR